MGRRELATDTARAVKARVQRHNLAVQAAGIAFFASLSLIPTLVALLSVYGLVADPEDIERQIIDLLETTPPETQRFVVQQLQSISTSSSGGVTLTFIASLLLALWSASGAVNQLLKTLHQVWEVTDATAGLRLRARALLLTAGAIVFVTVVGFVLTAVPPLLEGSSLTGWLTTLLNVLRFPGIAVVMALALGVLYQVGADGAGRRWRAFSAGAVVATVLWVVASIGFSVYVANFSSYNQTYGVLAGLVILQLWFYLTALLVLVGGEVDASLELRQEGL